MKRAKIELEAIAAQSNLVLALHKAALGKRHREQVAIFLAQAETNLNQMAESILNEQMPYGRFREFTIRDPKQRTIHAACFEDRVFHHAVMNLAAPVLERAMLPTSFACRPGLGVHRAADAAQLAIRRYGWYVQIDINAYFSCIDHEVLLAALSRRFKGASFIRQLQRLIACCPASMGKGLPIGSLTSQYFANYYLDGLDRLLDAHSSVHAHIRYMDDVVWWCDTKQKALQLLGDVQDYLQEQRQLIVKPNFQIQRSRYGISYCGYRILPGTKRLSIRRKRRYQQRRLYWEGQYRLGNINALQLQQAYAAVHSITQGTDCEAWRRQNLHTHPPISV